MYDVSLFLSKDQKYVSNLRCMFTIVGKGRICKLFNEIIFIVQWRILKFHIKSFTKVYDKIADVIHRLLDKSFISCLC